MSGFDDPYRLPASGTPVEYRRPAPGWPPPVPPAAARAPTVGEPERPYHLLLLRGRPGWWRPLLGLVLLVGSFVVLTVVVTIGVAAADAARLGLSLDAALDRFGTEFDPYFLLGTNLGLAVLIPASIIAITVAHRLRPGWLSSVVGRLRWGLLVRLSLLALGVIVVVTLAGGFLPTDDGAPTVDEIELVSMSTWLGFALVIVLTTPLQAAAEEYAFRGYAFQALSSWFKTPWVGAVLTSLAFALAHGTQNLPLFLDRFAFGLVACWLVVRTGGLEAAIAYHVVNNVVVFLLTAAIDEVGETLTMSEISWLAVGLDVGQIVVFAWLADRYVRRRGYQTRTMV